MTGIVFTDEAAHHYAQAIRNVAPDIPLWSLDDAKAPDADVAISWLPPHGAYGALPKLRLIHSIGAGVNHIIAETSDAHVPVCRIVDPEQARIMAQYVLWGVLHFHRGFDRLMRAQQEQRWLKFEHPSAGRTTVGIMGMGVMGQTVASAIARLGFDVRGWSRTGRELGGIRIHGEDELDRFLDGLDMLICLLPLTDATQGILSTNLFSRMNRGARLIHVGRGDHLVTRDLHAALDEGQLGGALIDVFPLEPLPSTDPLWTRDKVILTPHIAAISSSETVATQILWNVRSLRAGARLNNVIERARGY
ncbi:2-hydroxyacid dehydrogenase [Caballeronia sp. HLA56]